MIRTAYNETRFDFNIFCNEQGQDALANINPRKSFGWDTGAPTKLLMKVSSEVTPSLTSLYNKCIELSQWSTAWKMHERWTSFKESDRKEEKNYYSIKSLISVYTIFKHVLNKQLMGHYDPALYHRMTAYKKKRNNLVGTSRRLEVGRGQEELSVTILSTDMSKTFYSLCHALTIKKLDAYGLGSGTLDLIHSFFDKRLN